MAGLMKIVNISYVSFPEERDPDQWIQKSFFFKGIWEAVAVRDDVIFIDFIGVEDKRKKRGIDYWFFRRSKQQLLFPLSIHKAVRKCNPDVVIVHGMRSPLPVLLLSLTVSRKCKIVIQDHGGGYFKNRLKKGLQQLADRVVDAYFFTARQQAETLIQQGIIGDKNKVKEIMEVSSVFGQRDKTLSRGVTGVSGGDTYIWVGHLNRNKDPMLAIRAFTAHIAQRGNSAAKLYMIFQSDALLPEIELWLQQHEHAQKQVYLVGKVAHEQLPYWYSSVDFILATSHVEAGGVSVCEAMSCGCIPVLSDIPSFKAMTGGLCGILFETGSSAALTDSLRQSALMDKNRERQKTLGRFHQHLSFEAIAKRIHTTLQDL